LLIIAELNRTRGAAGEGEGLRSVPQTANRIATDRAILQLAGDMSEDIRKRQRA
jgi:hypothetical protein